MKIHNLSEEEVFRKLVTSPEGLMEDEARRRLLEFGPNEIKEVKKKSLYLRFLGQFTHFLAIILWVGAGLSFLSEYMSPGGGMLTLGLAIIAVIFINAIFTFIQEYRAEAALEALKRLLPFRVRVVREGGEKEMDSAGVVPGDVILIGEGDKVPADCRLIETAGLKVNNAPLTGESEPTLLGHSPFGGEFMVESPNIAFAGTTVLSGSGKAVVFSTGMRTEFGRIAHLTSAVEAGLSPLQKEIIKVSRIVAFIATIMGVVFFIIGHIMGRTFWENYLFAIGIIVANVPEGLLPTVTLSLAMGSQRMAKRKALIKTLTAVETLGSVTVICTDKTGTLTENKMAVKSLWYGGVVVPVGGVDKEEAGILLKTAYLCNNARFIEGQYKGEPTEVALFKAAREASGDIKAAAAERLDEIPFDSERKMMTTINLIGGRKIAFTKGAPESLLPLCSRIHAGKNIAALDEAQRQKAMEAYHAMMDGGMRVLAFAYKEMEGVKTDELEGDMVFSGLIGLEDPPRPEVSGAIAKCRLAGIRVIMITGDASRTALSVARAIGLVTGEPLIIESREFQGMSDAELRKRLRASEIIFARMTPKHKMRIVTVLQEEGERVAVTGDGVNDAPALKKADIGISMGITGTDVAKEASDMILLDDNFATIVNAIEEGRTVYENIRKFISYIFASNIPEIVPYLSYVLLRIPLPLTIIQILAIDLGTDMFPALALGAEKPGRSVMKMPPRGPKDRLLNFKLLSRAYLFLGPIEAAAGMFGFFYVLNAGGWHWGEMPPANNLLYMQATTACLTAIIITQVANVFACRSSRESVFEIGFFSNRLIFIGIAVELLLQLFIVYHPWGNSIFGTSPISAGVWLVLIPFAFILFGAEETRKWIVRKQA